MKRIYHALDGLDHSGIQDRLRDAKSDIEDLIETARENDEDDARDG
jgi:hypothetical protein